MVSYRSHLQSLDINIFMNSSDVLLDGFIRALDLSIELEFLSHRIDTTSFILDPISTRSLLETYG